MDLARGPTFPLTPPPYNTVRGKMQKRSAAAELARKQNHVFVHGTEVRDGEEGSSLTGGEWWKGEEGDVYKRARARAEIQLRSIDRLRSRQISVRCEIRRLVSLASWSRGLLASDTFDSSNRFVTGRNLETSTTISCSRPREISKGSRESRRTKFRIDRFGVNRLPR